MSTLRPFEMVSGGDAWSRASFDGTFLEIAEGVVELAWEPPPGRDPLPPPYGGWPPAGGLAFDAECRLYRSLPRSGEVTRTLWRLSGALVPADDQPLPVSLFAAEPPAVIGDFAPAADPGGPLRDPRGLAVDVDDRLFVAEHGAGRVLVHDLWSARLLRAVRMPEGTRPVDLAADGREVYAALDAAPGLVRFTARGEPEPAPMPPDVLLPSRIAVSPSGRLALLATDSAGAGMVVVADDAHHPRPVDRATDVEWESDTVLVVARAPGEDFLRWSFSDGEVEVELPLVARGYDGTGIVRTPDGRIGYATASGVKTAAVARVRYAQRGTVATFRLDAGEYQAQWGRVFLDACIPLGASLRVWCATADEVFDEPQLPRLSPPNVVALTIRRPDLSPPMPPRSIVPDAPEWHPVYRRDSGPELAWARPPAGDPFVTYEAPVMAAPGRFLWLWIELAGNSRVTPRVRAARVETRTHDLLRRLPRTFSRDEGDAGFLRRFLAICEGLIDELDGRAALRQVLLGPHATPEDMLPWLASFLGMALDDRFSVDARRTLVAEAAWLFRFRGTMAGLLRFLEIYLGEAPVLLEEYRLRGVAGAVLGDRGAAQSTSVLGGGFRVGGAVGESGVTPLQGTLDDAFELHAHRFSVLIRGALDGEQLQVVRDILDLHRPAHTKVEVCTLGAGMRVGRGLHLGISSTVGRTGGFRTVQLGAAALGRGTIVGRPETAVVPGATRLGLGSRVG